MTPEDAEAIPARSTTSLHDDFVFAGAGGKMSSR
jgi:hypothetical protein